MQRLACLQFPLKPFPRRLKVFPPEHRHRRSVVFRFFFLTGLRFLQYFFVRQVQGSGSDQDASQDEGLKAGGRKGRWLASDQNAVTLHLPDMVTVLPLLYKLSGKAAKHLDRFRNMDTLEFNHKEPKEHEGNKKKGWWTSPGATKKRFIFSFFLLFTLCPSRPSRSNFFSYLLA
jgi:hypothetical protein